MKKILLAVIALSASVFAQGPLIHGSGDPTTLSPVPNCGRARFYVDDSTQKMYLAAAGSPCVWIYAGSLGGGITNAAGANVLGKSDGTNIVGSSISDNGTLVSTAEPVQAAGFIVPQVGGVANSWNCTEGTAPTTDPAGNTIGGTGFDALYCDSTKHAILGKFNNGSPYPLAQTVASGTSAMGTSAISSGTCATVVTTTATGTATTDAITATPNADPTGVTGYAVSATGSLYIVAYPTANNVNFKVCNNTSGSLTPSALTLNWRVSR